MDNGQPSESSVLFLSYVVSVLSPPCTYYACPLYRQWYQNSIRRLYVLRVQYARNVRACPLVALFFCDPFPYSAFKSLFWIFPMCPSALRSPPVVKIRYATDYYDSIYCLSDTVPEWIVYTCILVLTVCVPLTYILGLVLIGCSIHDCSHVV